MYLSPPPPLQMFAQTHTHTHTHSVHTLSNVDSATLRCQTNHHLKSICGEIALAGTLRLEIGGLTEKTLEAQSLLEKREMEAKLAIQRQTEAEQHVHMDVSAQKNVQHICRYTCIPYTKAYRLSQAFAYTQLLI